MKYDSIYKTAWNAGYGVGFDAAREMYKKDDPPKEKTSKEAITIEWIEEFINSKKIELTGQYDGDNKTLEIEIDAIEFMVECWRCENDF